MESIVFKNVNILDNKSLNNMSKQYWRECFNFLKRKVSPSSQRTLRCGNRYATVNGRCETSYFMYDGDTQWERYCKFINDVLRTIRKDEIDYCFHVYQIMDLLKFEHDRLQAVWLPEHECFEVSLKK